MRLWVTSRHKLYHMITVRGHNLWYLARGKQVRSCIPELKRVFKKIQLSLYMYSPNPWNSLILNMKQIHITYTLFICEGWKYQESDFHVTLSNSLLLSSIKSVKAWHFSLNLSDFHPFNEKKSCIGRRFSQGKSIGSYKFKRVSSSSSSPMHLLWKKHSILFAFSVYEYVSMEWKLLVWF